MSELRTPKKMLVDGVPTLVIEQPGPVEVGLMFRVGRGDDPTYLLGITHLIEHLTLDQLRGREYEMNGMVSHLTTSFVASGTMDEAVDFLHGVCASLSNLSADRLSTELDVLAIEASDSGMPSPGARFDSHFGTTGLGATDYPGFGASSITFADVEALRQQYFTRENAVLFFTQEPPADLRLDLPHGERQEPPQSVVIDHTYPVAAPGFDVVGLRFVAPSSLAVEATMAILERRLTQRLRGDSGVTYSVEYDVIALDAERDFVWLSCDTSEAASREAWNAFSVEVQRFFAEGLTPEELEWRDRARQRQHSDPSTTVAQLMHEAESTLVGVGSSTRPGSVTRDDVLHVGAEALKTVIYTVPWDIAPVPGLPNIGYGDGEPVEGRSHGGRLPFGWFDSGRMVVGDEGLTVFGPGHPMTIHWSDVAVVQEYSNGAVDITDTKGTTAGFNPNEVAGKGGLEAIATLHQKVDKRRFIAALTDDPGDAIVLSPKPWVARWQHRVAGTPPQRLGPAQLVGALFSWVLASFVFVIFGAEVTGPTPDVGVALFCVALVGVAAALLLAAMGSRLTFVASLFAVGVELVGVTLSRRTTPDADISEILYFVVGGGLTLLTWLGRTRGPRVIPRISEPPVMKEPSMTFELGDELEPFSQYVVHGDEPADPGAASGRLGWLGGDGPRRLAPWQRLTLFVFWVGAFMYLGINSADTDPAYPALYDLTFSVVLLAILPAAFLPLTRSPISVACSAVAAVGGLALGFVDRTYDPPNSELEIAVFSAAIVVTLVATPWRRRPPLPV